MQSWKGSFGRHRIRLSINAIHDRASSGKEMSEPVRPTVSLDEPLFGLEEYLRDLGWKIVKVSPGVSDDEVVNMAKKNGYVIVSPDRKLLSRCRVLGVQIVDVGFEALARMVHQSLEKSLGTQP